MSNGENISLWKHAYVTIGPAILVFLFLSVIVQVTSSLFVKIGTPKMINGIISPFDIENVFFIALAIALVIGAINLRAGISGYERLVTLGLMVVLVWISDTMADNVAAYVTRVTSVGIDRVSAEVITSALISIFSVLSVGFILIMKIPILVRVRRSSG